MYCIQCGSQAEEVYMCGEKQNEGVMVEELSRVKKQLFFIAKDA